MHRFVILLCTAILGGVLLISCGSKTPSPAATTSTPLPPTASATPAATFTPTVPPVPLALRIDGEGISQAEFDASLAQLKQAEESSGAQATDEDRRKQVTAAFVDEALLARAAREAGHTLEDAALDERIAQIAAQRGGETGLNDWLAANGYTLESFRAALRRSLEAAWQRDQILNAVPLTAEQVHARQILVLTEAAARQVESQVKTAGANFATYAFGYDLSTGGDLGWFPRGYLTQPAVEEAAFALQPGEISAIIQTPLGYHIVQVIERQADRPLSPDARQALQRKALEDWLAQRRTQAAIEILTTAP